MVTVYRITPKVDVCQWALPDDAKKLREQGNLPFDGTAKLDRWSSPKYYIHNPTKTKSNFFIVSAGVFAFDQTVMDHPKMAMFFEMAGEILPLELETGEPLYILNTTEVVNALDRDNTSFRRDPLTGGVVAIEKHAFKPARFTQSPIFKIPETCRSEVLTFAGHFVNPDDEFIETYQTSGFTGLEFTKVWASELSAT